MQQFEQKRRQLLAMLIEQLISELQTQKLWQSKRPSKQALASVEPFAIDSLTFTQWLQFIFIEKIDLLLQSNLALPIRMAITPMATEYFKLQNCDSTTIVSIINRIDLVINEKAPC